MLYGCGNISAAFLRISLALEFDGTVIFSLTFHPPIKTKACEHKQKREENENKKKKKRKKESKTSLA